MNLVRPGHQVHRAHLVKWVSLVLRDRQEVTECADYLELQETLDWTVNRAKTVTPVCLGPKVHRVLWDLLV